MLDEFGARRARSSRARGAARRRAARRHARAGRPRRAGVRRAMHHALRSAWRAPWCAHTLWEFALPDTSPRASPITRACVFRTARSVTSPCLQHRAPRKRRWVTCSSTGPRLGWIADEDRWRQIGDEYRDRPRRRWPRAGSPGPRSRRGLRLEVAEPSPWATGDHPGRLAHAGETAMLRADRGPRSRPYR